jgi:hypothetical protein
VVAVPAGTLERRQIVAPTPGLERLAAEALIVLLHLAAALARIREGETNAALKALTELAQATPGGSGNPYAHEALYWRARLAAEVDRAKSDREARASARKDFRRLVAVLPEGRRRREVRVRLAALAEPGKVLGPDEARAASRRNLEILGLALHAYAADNGGALPETLFDLVGEYVTDPAVLVRPGPRGAGGARVYEYTPGLRADALRPPADDDEGGERWEVPVVVREPVPGLLVARDMTTPGRGGTRLVLGLDGAVRSVAEKVAAEREGGGNLTHGRSASE